MGNTTGVSQAWEGEGVALCGRKTTCRGTEAIGHRGHSGRSEEVGMAGAENAVGAWRGQLLVLQGLIGHAWELRTSRSDRIRLHLRNLICTLKTLW